MPLPYSLTTLEEMQRLFSAQGVVAFADHDENGAADAGVVDDCINYATTFVGGVLLLKFDLQQLASSYVVREIATVVACRTLCHRRGNPAPESLEMRYRELTEKDGLLSLIAGGLMQLMDTSGNILLGRSFAPTFSNLKVDRRHPHEKVRVVQQSSMPVETALERDVSTGIVEGGSGYGY